MQFLCPVIVYVTFSLKTYCHTKQHFAKKKKKVGGSNYLNNVNVSGEFERLDFTGTHKVFCTLLE